MRQHKQLSLIIIGVIAIGIGIGFQLWAEEGEVSLKYKLKEGEQFSEKVNMEFKVAGPGAPGDVIFTILCPTTYVVSGISEDGLIEMYFVYLPKVTEAIVGGDNGAEELQEALNAIEVGQIKMRKDGHIVESTEKVHFEDSPLVFKRVLELFRGLPSKTIKLGDTWEQTVEKPDIGKLEIKSSLTAFETVNDYDCAKLEGEITGLLYGPDNAAMKVKEGKYTAYFAIQEGMLITENIELNMDVDVPGQGKFSFQSKYAVEFVEKETLKPDQFKEKIAQLSVIKKGRDALSRGDNSGSAILQKFLTDYPKSPWREGVQGLLAKYEGRRTQQMVQPSYGGQPPPEQAKTQGYITEWLVLGPITNTGDAATSINIDFLDLFGGEANIRPHAGDKFEFDGETLTWQVHELPVSSNALGQLDGFGVDFAVAYMVAYLKFEKSEEVDLWLGSDDGIAVWLNGENVHSNPINRPWSPDIDRIRVKVDEGWNVLMVKVGDTGEFWTASVRFPNAKVLDTKFAWESQGEINTADGFNALIANQKGQFILTMDITEVGKDISRIDIILPQGLTNTGLIGDVLAGEKIVSATSIGIEGLLTIVLNESLTEPGKVTVNFGAIAGSAESEGIAFAVKLYAADGTIELKGGDANANSKDSNSFSGIAIANDSPVSAPLDVTAEPVEGENDVTIRWSEPEDKRIRAYQILADGKEVGKVYGRKKTDYPHLNLEAGTTVSYTVVALVTGELKSQPSDVAEITVGKDTTSPEPPTEVEESIDEQGALKITWRPSVSKDVVGYDILRGSAMDEMPKIATVPPDKTEYVDEDAPDDEVYSVRAVDDAGNMAMASMEIDQQMLYQKVQNYRNSGELGKLLAMTKRVMALGLEGNEKDMVQRELVYAYSRQNRLGELEIFFEDALKKSPENADLYKMLGQIYQRQRDYDRSVEAYEKAVELTFDDPEAHLNLGYAYRSQKFYDEAIASFRKAMELEPGRTYIYGQIARAYAESGRKDEVLELAGELQEKLETEAEQRDGVVNAHSYATLGDVYSAGGFHDKAIAAHRKSVELRPEEPYLWDRLSRAYMQAGQRDIGEQIRRVMPQYGPRGTTGPTISLAPSISMQDITGKTINLLELQDKLVLVNFWATWCPDCLGEMPILEKLYEKYQGNLVVIGVSVDKAENAAGLLSEYVDKVEHAAGLLSEYIEKRKITYPIVIATNEILDAFETAGGEPVDTIPTTIVIGKGGFVLKKCVGAQEEKILKQECASGGILPQAEAETPQPPGTGTIKGWVIDTSTARNPVSGASITYVGPGNAKGEVKTDESGKYEITRLSPGQYVISVNKSGYAKREGIPATVISGADSILEIKLRVSTK